jgi:hypothetical protein
MDIEPEIYQLNTNNKGHFIYDVVFHPTRGHTNQQGSAVVHVDRKHQQAMVSILQSRPLEFYQSQVDRSAAEEVSLAIASTCQGEWRSHSGSFDVQLCTAMFPRLHLLLRHPAPWLAN